jgi:hypothetical protein
MTGVVLGVFALAAGLVLAGLILWASDQYAVGVSTNGTALVMGLILVAVGCLAGSYRLLRVKRDRSHR